MEMDMSAPDWAKHAADKIWDELQLAPNEGEAWILLASLLHGAHARWCCDGDRHRAALELAALYTEIADKLNAMGG
jgi:hypothetical protein